MQLLRCLGEAFAAKGLKVLAGVLPLGSVLYEIVGDTLERYRRLRREGQILADAEAMIQASAEEVRADAEQIAREVLADRPVAEVVLLQQFLTQVPAVARQSLKRPADPSGKTVPAQMNLLDPTQFASLMPKRMPRFQAGESVPDAPQWQFVELLGAGGFGEVWLAQHRFMEHQRAFKFCLDEAARERLLKHEAEVIKQVMRASAGVKDDAHGIVPLLDAHLSGETPWLAYEYIDGGDLATLVREMSGLKPIERAKQSVQLLADLAEVVGQLHTRPLPIIHRDLKPANVLVKRHGKESLLRVTDFGISHVASDLSIREASASTPSMHLGETFRGAFTPIYASPQQKRGMKPDVRDDVYALGIIGWQLLVGDLGAERPSSKWRNRLKDCELGYSVLDLIESCWEDEREDRPPNALVLAEALKKETHPILPSAPSIIHPPKVEAKIEVPPAQERLSKRFTNSLGMEFACVPKGTFWMGGGDGKCGDKQVTIDNDFYIGIYPVTQEEWQKVMGSNPSHFQKGGKGADKLTGVPDGDIKRFPVESVSWNDCQEFIRKLNEKSKESGWMYRLPREAEWEYACRGGATSQADCSWNFYFRSPTQTLWSSEANFGESNLGRTSKVGKYEPNPLGIFDMHGNVWEWCEDAIDRLNRVERGGGWYSSATYCRAAYRNRISPSSTYDNLGFRLARVLSGSD